MAKLKQIILLIALTVMAIACGGGGGGGGSTTNTDVGFRFSGGKEGDAIIVYGLDGTFNEPSPFVGSANYIDSVAAIELDEGNYRVRLNTKSDSSENSFETLEFIILSSDFSRLIDGSLNMGEMSAATTYISAKAFSTLSSTSEKPRLAASDITSALGTYFSARNITSFSDATLENIASNSAFSDELLFIHLLEINLKRLDATTNSDTESEGESKWNSVIDSVVDMANDIEATGNISSDSISAYISATTYLEDIDLSSIDSGNSLLGADNIQDILDVAQATSSATFSLNYDNFLGNEIEDDFARVDLTTGAVTFSDEVTLTASDNTDVMVFAKVPTSTNYRYRGETVNNTIELSEYYVSIFEVTQAQYAKLITSATISEANNPVSDITQTDALSFISSLNTLSTTATYNLPTEAQWENAARAGTDDAKFGEDFSTANSSSWVAFENGGLTTQDEPVGLSSPNAYDLHDIHGNVAEMCLDSLTDANLGQTDPVGSSSNIAIRGGSYINKVEDCTVGSKSTASTSNSNPAIGFRVVFKKN